ncbi:DUF5324 family protein [Streptomyces sp. NPDC051940]|uniref:DUF5324 family protein n=1 Tax=Streptomyces sp. NPDC051940 TaxID=3155675 RepID=UPI00341FE3F2
MTRKNGVHTASGTARDSVKHAAEVVAPYASSARDQCLYIAGQCVHYASETKDRLGPKAAILAHDAQAAYYLHLHPHVKKARARMPEGLDRAATMAALRTRHAAAYAGPKVAHAASATKDAAIPVAKETAARSTAALHALRGHVTPKDIEKLARKKHRRQMAGHTAKNAAVVGAVGATAFAAWRWWDRQVNPDWLVEPPAATEVREESVRIEDDTEYMNREARVDRAESALDPEVQTKQAQDDLNEGGNPTDTSRGYYEREDNL